MKKLQLAMAISMLLGAGVVLAAPNANDIINIQQAQGTANFDNITGTATGGTQTINIYQASSGAGAADLGSAATLNAATNPTNTNNTNQVSLLVNGTANAATVNIGQGYYNNAGTWTASATGGTNKNLVYGTVTEGSANISQNSDGNTVKLNLGAGGTGLVTVNQGFAGSGGGGGSGFTANIAQTGAATVTLNQGNTDPAGGTPSTATSGTATVNNAGSGTISITQDNTAAASAGTVLVHTASGNSGTKSLTITQAGIGTVNVDNAGSAVALNGTAVIQNTDGTVNLTKIDGTVGVYNNGLGTLNVSNGGSTNKVFVNAEGTAIGTTAVTLGGTLSLAQDAAATNNNIFVTGFSTGTLAVNQTSTASYDKLTLQSGTSTGTDSVINQTGQYQNALVNSVNASTGTFNLNATGTALANANVALKM